MHGYVRLTSPLSCRTFTPWAPLGLVTAGFESLYFPFLYSSHSIRPEILLAFAHSDQQEAAIGPRVAADLAGISGPHFFWGNDFGGFPYHLKAAGWKAYDPKSPLKEGEALLVPRNFNVHGPPPFLNDPSLQLIGIFPYHITSPLRTHSIGAAAGWYSASWGALPYAWSQDPAETFYLYRRSPSKE